MLTQPTQALTDLLLGVVVVCLAFALRRLPTIQRYWRAAFWWAGVAALAGFVHHGFLARWPDVARISWSVVSVVVVLAVSYLLAATVEEVLGPGHARAFWLLRSVGVIAYAVLAATGHAGITAMLACESLTMTFVIGLWSWAAYQGNPLARPVLVAIVASAAAAGTKALSPNLTGRVGLDPTSTYHLAQIVGMVLLFRALTDRRRERPPATGTGSVAASAR